MSDGEAKAGLRRNVGLVGVVVFGAGTAIGVSIFTVLQPAAQIAGSGMLVAIGLAAIPMLLFAAVYAYLGSALPVAGASYEWPRRFLGPFAGFVIAWLRILGNVGAMTVLALVMIKYLGMVVSLPLKPAMAVAITAVFVLNHYGISMAARAQVALMLLLLAVLAALVALGAPRVELQNIGSPLSVGWVAIGAGVPLLISLFLGIEASVEIGEEVRNPRRNLPLGIAIAIALTALVYGSVAFVSLGLVGPARLAATDAPLLEAARVPFGAWAGPVIVTAATASILKSMNALVVGFSRSLFAMGRTGVLPGRVAQVHARHGTPHVAIWLAYALVMTGLLMPDSIVFLLLAVNVPTMLKYVACSLSATRVAKHHPQLHAQSRLGFSTRTATVLGYLAAAVGLLLIVLGVEADWRPYVLIAVWFLVGLVYWSWRRPHVEGIRVSTGSAA
ncbi:MAG: APC family permease [Steroidobacteraceae bacterium]|nr:APC family permease [Steroidobacteraceae bacterium]MCW5571614.1 APC family permease [Steroidobacteraceae bacterium]